MNNYVLEHGYQWISGNPLHAKFWDPPVFFPVANTASYTDILLGSAPLYWAFRFAGIVPDTAFQLWVIFSGALNFVVCYGVLRYSLSVSPMAATGGAYVFAFAGMRVSMLNAPQLLPHYYSLLAVACLFGIFRSRNTRGPEESRSISRQIGLFCLCVVLQLYAGFYLGFFLVFGLLIAFATALLFPHSRRALMGVARLHPWTILLSSAVSAMALSWMAYHYIISQLLFGPRPWSEIAGMLPQLKSWINMGPANWIYGWTTSYLDLSLLPDGPEQRLGPGLVTFGVAVFGFRLMRNHTWGRIGIVVFLAVLGLSLLYPWGWTPWQVVAHVVPGASAIRCVSRVALLLLVPLSFAIGWALHRCRSAATVTALCLIMALEQVQTTPAYDKHVIRDRVRAIASLVPSGCKAFYFVTTPSESRPEEPWFELQIDGMWAQTLAHKPTVNGFSGQVPPDWARLGESMIRSRWDLLIARVNLFRWADFNGLPPESLSLVTALRKPLQGPEPDVSVLTLDMGRAEARPFLGHGWGEDEWDKDETWTWAVGRRADLYIPLKAHVSYAIDLVAAPIDTRWKRQILTVKMNGMEVAHFTMAEGMHSYKVTAPASVVKDVNKIEFAFGFAVSPAVLGKASDDRQLAAAFDKIQFVRSRAVPQENGAQEKDRTP